MSGRGSFIFYTIITMLVGAWLSMAIPAIHNAYYIIPGSLLMTTWSLVYPAAGPVTESSSSLLMFAGIFWVAFGIIVGTIYSASIRNRTLSGRFNFTLLTAVMILVVQGVIALLASLFAMVFGLGGV
jgi:hypothetical protein